MARLRGDVRRGMTGRNVATVFHRYTEGKGGDKPMDDSYEKISAELAKKVREKQAKCWACKQNPITHQQETSPWYEWPVRHRYVCSQCAKAGK